MELKDIATIYDCPHSTAPDEGVGYALIRTPNIGKGRLLLDNVHRVSKEVYDKRNKRAVPQEGDIIFAREAPAGNAALITKGQNVCLGQRTVLIKPNHSICDSEFLVYYLLAPEQQTKLLGFSHGATVEHVNISELSKLPLILPSLKVQRRIASILSAYDNLIENNNKRIRLLEQMAENLYKEWFVRFRFPGHEKVEMENGLPKGWRISRIKDFGRIETGKTPSMENPEYYGGDYLFIKTPDMYDSMFVFNTTETISDKGNQCQKKKLLPVNSIMVSCIGSGGVVSINAKQGHTNQQINSIILHNQTYLEWLYFTCRSLKTTIELFGATGATMTNLSKGKFENLKVIEPEKNIVTQFNVFSNPIFEQIKNLSTQNDILTRQRDLLLPRLMSGKLEVKE